ncbi:NUDIX domain-containing protein [Candidatus Berkelbacteria bacterium]|nr:NUDIX domain-containing protein [Candidatus Berkelbacteria bacterium]
MADTLSLRTLSPRPQPKIVTLLAIQNDRDEWLLYRRKKEPFAGLVGFPYGKIHLGETIEEAAGRELQEKTGLEATLRHAGDAYLTVRRGEGLLSHMLVHVFVGNQPRGELTLQSSIGTCFWRAIEQVNPADAMPGFLDLAAALKQESPAHFFHEFVYDSSHD